MSSVIFSDLRTAAYCPRKLYYARRDDDREPPPSVAHVRALATRYDELRHASDADLKREPIEREPAIYRRQLEHTRDRLVSDSAGNDGTHTRWDDLCHPERTNVLVTGRHCRGIVHKVLTDPLEPSIVAVGAPPERGVWHPQSVHAVAAAKALSWEHQTPVAGAWLEYPAYGVIRYVNLTTRRKAEYRRVLRTVRSLEDPPARVSNRSKCDSCAYADTCGVRTRTLRSLLGFG